MITFGEMQIFSLQMEAFSIYWYLKIHEKTKNGTFAIFTWYFLIDFLAYLSNYLYWLTK